MSFLFLLLLLGLFLIARVRIPLTRTRPLFIAYLAILVLSTAVYYGIAEPADDTRLPGGFTPMTREEYLRSVDEFYEALHRGELERYPQALLNTKQSFTFSGERLTIASADGRFLEPLIYILRDGVADTIEASVYQPAFAATRTAGAPQFRLEGNQLLIHQAGPVNIEVVVFRHDFTLTQFGAEKRAENGIPFFGMHQVILLRVPEGVQIDGDEKSHFNIIDLE
jgi:hypothetical protein